MTHSNLREYTISNEDTTLAEGSHVNSGVRSSNSLHYNDSRIFLTDNELPSAKESDGQYPFDKRLDHEVDWIGEHMTSGNSSHALCPPEPVNQRLFFEHARRSPTSASRLPLPALSMSEPLGPHHLTSVCQNHPQRRRIILEYWVLCIYWMKRPC
jgi:hypothetical protein